MAGVELLNIGGVNNAGFKLYRPFRCYLPTWVYLYRLFQRQGQTGHLLRLTIVISHLISSRFRRLRRTMWHTSKRAKLLSMT